MASDELNYGYFRRRKPEDRVIEGEFKVVEPALAARLRDAHWFVGDPLLKEAADEIERLRAALEKIAQHDMQAIAMDALRPGERIRSADKGEKP